MLVGEEAEVRRDGLVAVNGELWRARRADGRPLPPGEHVTVEAVEDDLVLRRRISATPPKGRSIVDIALIVVAVVVLIAARAPVRDRQGRAGVRARRHLPARPAAAGAEGAGPVPPDPVRRPDGEGRPAHGDAERAAAGGDHEGQRAGARQRRRLLPDRRAEGGDRPGRELHERHLPDRADDAALGARPARARRAALRARQDQRDPADDHRRRDLALGHQGLDRRGQGRRDPERHAAGDGAPGRGRARAARQGDLGRGRVPGVRAAQGRRGRDGAGADHGAAALPADAARDRVEQQLDDRLPDPDRPADGAVEARRRATPSTTVVSGRGSQPRPRRRVLLRSSSSVDRSDRRRRRRAARVSGAASSPAHRATGASEVAFTSSASSSSDPTTGRQGRDVLALAQPHHDHALRRAAGALDARRPPCGSRCRRRRSASPGSPRARCGRRRAGPCPRRAAPS